jgi:hypothetical protein
MATDPRWFFDLDADDLATDEAIEATAARIWQIIASHVAEGDSRD